MAPLPVINDCFRVSFEYQKLGQTAANVIHVISSTLDSGQVLERIQEFWEGDQLATMSADATLVNMTCIPLDGTSGTVEQATDEDVKWSGSSGSESMPQVSVLIKLSTGLRGKEHRGRIYLPFTDESKQDEGLVAPSIVPLVTEAWVTWSNAIIVAGLALGVASYKLETVSQVLNLTCEPATGTQRRRQTRVRTG